MRGKNCYFKINKVLISN